MLYTTVIRLLVQAVMGLHVCAGASCTRQPAPGVGPHCMLQICRGTFRYAGLLYIDLQHAVFPFAKVAGASCEGAACVCRCFLLTPTRSWDGFHIACCKPAEGHSGALAHSQQFSSSLSTALPRLLVQAVMGWDSLPVQGLAADVNPLPG